MKFLYIGLLILISITICNCSEKTPDLVANDYAVLVDPMIGTDWNGHTFPGATLPNGMVQLSPDTKTRTWSNCSGYHYSDTSILGFSHTHYSGTGEGGGSDILFMPTTGEIKLNSGEDMNDHDDDYTLSHGIVNEESKIPEDTSNGYRSKFSHEKESVSPGYYAVFLDDYAVNVELTTTKRVGMHKYIFPETKEANVILDLVSGNSDVPDSLYVEINEKEISGYRAATGALDGSKTIYFVAEFSKLFEGFGISVDDQIQKEKRSAKGKNVKAYFRFITKKNESILLKVAISSVSIEGARKNMEAELPGWNFEKIRSKSSWYSRKRYRIH